MSPPKRDESLPEIKQTLGYECEEKMNRDFLKMFSELSHYVDIHRERAQAQETRSRRHIAPIHNRHTTRCCET